MSHLNPGLISAYNSLTDKHLAGYFSNTRIRRHLQRVGLITRSGRIVPDKEYRTRLMQRVHQRHVRECLAQAIFHKVLDMERVHQIDIKRRLEEFARRERVHKMKVERSKRYEEDLIQILSPRPPTGPRGVRTQHSVPEGEPSESSESPGSSRPNTAPGTMQRPARLQPITSSSTAASLRRRHPRRHRGSADHRQQPLDSTTDSRNPQRREFCQGISPYCLPVINNFVTPVPPTTKRRDRATRVTSNGTIRGRRLRSTNAPGGADVNEEPPMLRSSVHQSRVGVNMVYFGKTVHLSRDLVDLRDEVKVFQQHCGGENLCVYKGRLQEGEAFQFVSRRHRGFPFSLTFFLNGLQVERISSCCEFKHRRGSRLTGRHKHFGFTGVEGASPCYKCIIAMGLDKKPSPPPKRVTDDTETETTSSPSDVHKETAEEKEEVEEDGKERAVSTADPGTPQPQDMETDIKEEIIHEDKPRDDYEEDFEADDEADENSKAKPTKAPSLSSDKEEQRKEKYASDSEDDDGDEDRRSRSGSRSSSSERQSEEEDTKEDHQQAPESKDPRGDADPPEPHREEPPAEPAAEDPPTEVDTPDTEIPVPSSSPPPPSPPTEPPAPPAAAQDAENHDGPGGGTGETAPEESETSVPPGNEGKGHEDTSTAASAAEAGEGEGEPAETERAKSVQEKLAEAILTAGQCHSEPELSDTTTEEDEESPGKNNQQNNKDASPIECETSETQQPTQPEEPKCEASVVDAAEVGEEETVEQKDNMEELKAKQINEAGDEKDDKCKAEEETPALEEDRTEETTETEKEDSEEKEDMEASPPEEPEEKAEAENQEAASQADEPETGDTKNVEEVVEVEEEEDGMEADRKKEDEEEEVVEEEDGVEADRRKEDEEEEVEEVVEEDGVEADRKKEEVVEEEDGVEADRRKEDEEEEVEEVVEEEDGVEADSQTEPEAKNNEANEESTASEPEEKKDVETALQRDAEERQAAEERQTAAAGQTADTNTQPSEEPADVSCGERPVSGSGKLGAGEAIVEMAQAPVESSSSSSELSGAAAVLQVEQTAAAETSGTKIDHDKPVEDLHEESASHEEAGRSGEEMESFRGRMVHDTGGEGGSLTSVSQNNVEKDNVEKQVEGKDNNVEKGEAGQVEATEESDLKAKEHTGNDKEEEEEEEEEEECKTEEVSMQKVEAVEAIEQTEDGKNAEAKDTLEGSYDKASEVADEEKKEEKPEKDIEETGDENCLNKVDEEGSEKQVAEIENSIDTKDGSQSTEDQAGKQAEQIEENEAQKQASETAEEPAKTTVDQEPAKEAEKTSEESSVETENVGDALKANKAIGIQPEDKAEEIKGNMLGSDGDHGEGKVNAENGEAGQGTSAETKENNEDRGNEGNQAKDGVVGEKIDPKHPEEPNKEKEEEEGRTNDHEEKDNQCEQENVDQGPRVEEVPQEAKLEEEQVERVSEVVEAAESEEAKELPDKKDTDIDHEGLDEDQGKGSEMNTTKEHGQNHGVIVDSLEGQTKSSEPTVVDTADNVDDEKVESITESALNIDDKHPDTVVACEPTAVNGEHSADTEEGSKPSEEAESVVFKPEAELAQPTVHQAAQSRDLGKDDPGLLEVNETNEKESVIPDVLESKDNRDNLVTDWVTLHQTSKYFEKFVESLDDMKELPSSAGASDDSLLRSASPPQNMTRPERNEENIEKNKKEREPFLNNSNNSPDNTKVELARSDLTSNHSEGQEEREPAKDKQQLKEETEVTTAVPTSEADQSTEESTNMDVKGESTLGKHKDNTGSSEGDRDQDAPTKGNIENCDSSKMETEDVGENNNVETNVQPESTTDPDSELQQEKEEVKDEPEVEENQTTVEEIKNQPSSDHADGCHEALKSPGGPSEPTPSHPEAQRDDTKETMESKEADNTDVTSVTDLNAVTELTSSSTSDNGTDEGGQNKPQVQSKPLERSGSLNGESKEVQLIEDFKPTVSKDQLSTYRVEETSLFGRSSYPQFTTQTGSGY